MANHSSGAACLEVQHLLLQGGDVLLEAPAFRLGHAQLSRQRLAVPHLLLHLRLHSQPASVKA